MINLRELKNGLDIVEGTTRAVTIFYVVPSKRYECNGYLAQLANHYYCTCCGGFVT